MADMKKQSLIIKRRAFGFITGVSLIIAGCMGLSSCNKQTVVSDGSVGMETTPSTVGLSEPIVFEDTTGTTDVENDIDDSMDCFYMASDKNKIIVDTNVKVVLLDGGRIDSNDDVCVAICNAGLDMDGYYVLLSMEVLPDFRGMLPRASLIGSKNADSVFSDLTLYKTDSSLSKLSELSVSDMVDGSVVTLIGYAPMDVVKNVEIDFIAPDGYMAVIYM